MKGLRYIALITLTAFFFGEAGSVRHEQDIKGSNPSSLRRHSREVPLKLEQELSVRAAAFDKALPPVASNALPPVASKALPPVASKAFPPLASERQRARRKGRRRNRLLPRNISKQKRKNSNVTGQAASHLKLRTKIQKQLQQKLKERRKKAKILKRKRARAKNIIKQKKLARKKKQKEKQKALLLKRKRQKARKAAKKKARQLRRKNKLRNKKKTNKKKTNVKVKAKKSKTPSTSDQKQNVGSQIDLTNSLDILSSVLVDPSQMRPTVFKDNWSPKFAESQPTTQEDILRQSNPTTDQHSRSNNSLGTSLSAPFQKTIIEKTIDPHKHEVQSNPDDAIHMNVSNTNSQVNEGQTGKPAMGHSTISHLSDLNRDFLLNETLNDTFHELPEQPLRVVSFQDVNIGPDGTLIFLNEPDMASQSAGQNMLDSNIHDSGSPTAALPAMGETSNNKPKLPGDSLNSQHSPVAPSERQHANADSFFNSLFQDLWV